MLQREILKRCTTILRKQFFSTHSRKLTEVDSDLVQVTTSGLLSITTKLDIVDTASSVEKWPVFRILSPSGRILEGAEEPELDKELAQKMYKMMIRIQSIDDVFYNVQRQGRISFYMQNIGEEATQIGSASSLTLDDVILGQYREFGVLLYRGFSIQQAADQCFSNEADLGKGRQMPVHYGSRELNFQTISSPLATQMPQAVGVAYALKMSNSNGVAVCYFGEGAASEGDFHAALNFSATLEVPCLFICRNNGYAISTPTRDQYRGDGIASRAVGYGMHCIRVDGNDILAVRKVTEEAKKLALEKSCPVLIEMMTYRRGHHSTSDDSTRYRSATEIKHWDDFDPVMRFRSYLENKGWWDENQERNTRDSERAEVLKCLEIAEKRSKPPMSDLFTDVFADKPAHLIKQEQELMEHVKKYPDHYEKDGH